MRRTGRYSIFRKSGIRFSVRKCDNAKMLTRLKLDHWRLCHLRITDDMPDQPKKRAIPPIKASRGAEATTSPKRRQCYAAARERDRKDQIRAKAPRPGYRGPQRLGAAFAFARS